MPNEDFSHQKTHRKYLEHRPAYSDSFKILFRGYLEHFFLQNNIPDASQKLSKSMTKDSDLRRSGGRRGRRQGTHTADDGVSQVSGGITGIPP